MTTGEALFPGRPAASRSIEAMPCAAERRERAAVELAAALRPWTTLIVAVVIGLWVTSFVLAVEALDRLDRTIQLAERV